MNKRLIVAQKGGYIHKEMTKTPTKPISRSIALKG